MVFVIELISDALSSPTQCNKAVMPRMKVITTLQYLASGKNAAVMTWVCCNLSFIQQSDHTHNYRAFIASCCCSVHLISNLQAHKREFISFHICSKSDSRSCMCAFLICRLDDCNCAAPTVDWKMWLQALLLEKNTVWTHYIWTYFSALAGSVLRFSSLYA